MNFSKTFSFFSSLFISIIIAFIYNVNLLKNLFKDMLLLRSYELESMIKRNLAEMIPDTLEDDNKVVKTKLLNKDELIDKYIFAEHSASLEILKELVKNKNSTDETYDCMERDLSIINGIFSKNGIILSANGIMNVYSRIGKRYILFEKNSTEDNDDDFFRSILSIEKSITGELLKKIIFLEDRMIDKSNYIPILLDTLHLIDANEDSIIIRKYIFKLTFSSVINEIIYDIISFYNVRFREDERIDLPYVTKLLNLEGCVLHKLVSIVVRSDDDAVPIYYNSKLVLREIFEMFSKNNIDLSFLQFKNIYLRLLENFYGINSGNLTREIIDEITNSHRIERSVITQIVSEELENFNNGEEQEGPTDINSVKDKVAQQLQSRNITLEQHKVDKIVHRIHRYVTDDS
ncbi:hypothetical protein PGAL8A_00448900 [Plasmodium gallinaceum]|uniref:Uncharacterized protein n=1 Tax=Plasmodium gallinaceum TaxID=5849 RepID=A0A1J1GWU1_PLAGA|nr:hypothetical protein PGAL8A_00448900 [Plasmodium gallinaceum]CRG96908.1 hypothetical protein PGAL8A_00448900 [Plasmodium gallinaceum]